MADGSSGKETQNNDIHSYILRMRHSLRSAVSQCNERGLVMSAKWAAEQLLGFSAPSPKSQPSNDLTPASAGRTSTSGEADTGQPNQNVTFLNLSSAESMPAIPKVGYEEDLYLYAKACFDAREFPHAAEVLQHCTARRSVFLRLYSKLMAAESSQPIESFDSPQDTPSPETRRILIQIEHELTMGIKEGELDGFLWYLIGITVKKLGKRELGIQYLTKAVQKYPYNWSAWVELASCMHMKEDLESVLGNLQRDFMTGCFEVYVENVMEYQMETDTNVVDALLALCPQSRFLKIQRAILYYNARNMEPAELVFEELLSKDQCMIEGMGIYSNVLFLRGKKRELMSLAHRVDSTYKYRPESAVVLGNYHSLKSDRSKAIKSFERALKLDRNYADAWTLLGHEYVELNNAAPAIQIYRRAVDLNCRDYRAWYGLGQAYDLLNLPMFSLNYYQRALTIRPRDGRMWNVLSMTFEKLNKIPEAIKCGLHMLLSDEYSTPITLRKMSKLYMKLHAQTGNAKHQDKAVLYENRANTRT
ncbi:hypothetical protein BASA81_007192 [Batrachochytrium salamandrivorans]|nr:hypothetical protein BASA81_007192 [Batrachochytrium salamandrivorans]